MTDSDRSIGSAFLQPIASTWGAPSVALAEEDRTALLAVAETEDPDSTSTDPTYHASICTLDAGELIWDGVSRIRVRAVSTSDGEYVEALTISPRDGSETLMADWPVDLHDHHQTARTIWHLLGLLSI